MNRAQFMEQLKKLLSDISEAERQEALDYYESYFDDAGQENEPAVIRELGSPGKVAAIIKADLSESNDKYAEYTELGYEDTRAKEPGQVPDKYTGMTVSGSARGKKDSGSAASGSAGQRSAGQSGKGASGGAGRERAYTGGTGSGSTYTGSGAGSGSAYTGSGSGSGSAYTGSGSGTGGAYDRKFGRQRAGETAGNSDSTRQNAYGPGQAGTSRRERGYHAERKRSNGAIIMVLILLVFLSPFIKGAVGGVLGVIVTIALLPFLLIFALGAGVFGLIIAAVVCGFTGIGLCFTYPAAGILTIGIGCLMMAVGIVFLVVLVWLAGKIVPKLMRRFTDFCYNLLHKDRKGGAGV